MRPTLGEPTFTALNDLIRLGLIYRSTRTVLEIERLFLAAGTTLDDFVESIKRQFTVETPILQIDEFLDFEGTLATIDAYFRLREERSLEGVLLAGEIKASYPGAASNANVRPKVDLMVDEAALTAWRKLCLSLGMTPERRYRKTRVSCSSKAPVDGHIVELEVDCFEDGGPLSGRTFVSFSIETAGQAREDAERSLTKAIKSTPGRLIDCGRSCYEDFYYGRSILPS